MARNATISSITFISTDDRDDNLKRANELIDQAAIDKPDLIVLPEVFRESPNCLHKPSEVAEAIDGPTVTTIAAKARQHSCYFVCPLVERLNGKCYNAAALIDRKGSVVGKYHKYYPTIGELEAGVAPGESLPVFTTDFGKVGIAICYDLNFWDVGEGLAKAGAEIIAFPSQYRGGQQFIAWAYRLGCYMVSATPTEHSRIVDPLGRILADSSMHAPIITSRLNLDRIVVHIDYNAGGVAEAKKKYGGKLEVVVASPEGLYMLINHDPKTTIDQIVREFNIEPLPVYYDRARATRKAALKS